MQNIYLKKISFEQVYELQAISKNTFIEAFSAENTAEDMEKYLNESLSIEKLNEELANPNSIFYFALKDEEIIGYLKLNFGQAQTVLKQENWLEIERIYVLKSFYGKKIGQILFEKALQKAKQTNIDYLWLGVWEKNKRAISFYTKNGLVEFDKHIFILGNDEQIDIMMKLQIN